MKCRPCRKHQHKRCTDNGCDCECGGLELEWPATNGEVALDQGRDRFMFRGLEDEQGEP